MTQPLRIVSIARIRQTYSINPAGTMAHHTSRGDYVACVVLTHGARARCRHQ